MNEQQVQMRAFLSIVVGCVLALRMRGGLAQSAPPIGTKAAAAAFSEAHALCSADDGHLWGVSLCGPMMFVDPQSHQAVGNQSVTGAVADGAIFRFSLPSTIGVSNTSLDFAGSRWTMIRWPLPSDADARAVLLMHESYHRIQSDIGLVGSSGLGANGHLDTEAGRIWLRGELHALRAALTAAKEARRIALRDALLMRAYRRSLFSAAASSERQVEINEGLAESSGIDAGLQSARRIAYALRDLSNVESSPSYVREFPYGTGPAYAELLDAVRADWRKTLPASADLATFTGSEYGINIVRAPETVDAEDLLSRYDGIAIQAEEAERTATLAVRKQRYEREFVDGPTLSMPLRHFRITFDPTAVEQFGERGSVYHALEITDDWGSIKLAGGDALINPSFDVLTIQAPASISGQTLNANGWTLHITPSYRVAHDPAKPKAYVLVKSP